MARKVRGGFECTYCGTKYPDSMKADACRDSHDLIYVPLTRTELNRLLNGLFLQDFSVIPDSVFDTLRKIQRKSVTDGVQKKVS